LKNQLSIWFNVAVQFKHNIGKRQKERVSFQDGRNILNLCVGVSLVSEGVFK